MSAERPDLVHDWNVAASRFVPERPVELDDETLRDGLQSPSVRDPDLDRKLRIVRLMDALGIDTCDV
ncbi:MAG TPA: 2-isopropylmalate synthase, partial [Planctomycetota bacterium]|nr:2-isopropylmalate synthase [Planctomycetota bacterium]